MLNNNATTEPRYQHPADLCAPCSPVQIKRRPGLQLAVVDPAILRPVLRGPAPNP